MTPDLKPGDWVALSSMPDDPDPIPRGTSGKVLRIVSIGNGQSQVEIEWENGRTLSAVVPPDRLVKLPYQHSQKKCLCATSMVYIDPDCFCVCHFP